MAKLSPRQQANILDIKQAFRMAAEGYDPRTRDLPDSMIAARLDTSEHPTSLALAAGIRAVLELEAER